MKIKPEVRFLGAVLLCAVFLFFRYYLFLPSSFFFFLQFCGNECQECCCDHYDDVGIQGASEIVNCEDYGKSKNQILYRFLVLFFDNMN